MGFGFMSFAETERIRLARLALVEEKKLLKLLGGDKQALRSSVSFYGSVDAAIRAVLVAQGSAVISGGVVLAPEPPVVPASTPGAILRPPATALERDQAVRALSNGVRQRVILSTSTKTSRLRKSRRPSVPVAVAASRAKTVLQGLLPSPTTKNVQLVTFFGLVGAGIFLVVKKL